MISPAARALLDSFVDYAGLYPPASLAMGAAIAEYTNERAGALSWMLGRFIVPVSRLDELMLEIEAHQRSKQGALAPYVISAIVDVTHGGQPWLTQAGLQLEKLAALAGNMNVAPGVLEVPMPRLLSERDTYDAMIGQFAAQASKVGMRHLPIYMEFPRDQRWLSELPSTMTVLARYRCGAKIRCGGVTAEAFPSAEELAAYIFAATEAGVPFKATAGLHHPVRALDPAGTGFMMHGFLNVLVATLVARAGGSTITIEAVLGEEDRSAFRIQETTVAWRHESFDLASIEALRRDGFVAYGSCSIDEPVNDLIGMGILTARE